MRTPIIPDLIRGAVDLEPTEHGLLPHRLPAWARAQVPDDQLAQAESQPSGVRLVFRTTATTLELDVLATKLAYVGAPPRPDGVYDLVVDGRLAGRATADGGNVRSVDMATGAATLRPGRSARSASATCRREASWWSSGSRTTRSPSWSGCAATPPSSRAPPDRRTWVHHGSSISHGSNAESPSTTWPALAASRAGVDLVNLGFGGGALLDPFVARTVRDLPADLLSVKIGINLVNTDLMRLRALAPAVHGFLDTIREGHPTTPLLVISPIRCEIHERTPDPRCPTSRRSPRDDSASQPPATPLTRPG